MNFSEYENSYMILDQSAWQQVEFWMTACNLNVYSFLRNKNIQATLTSDSVGELGYQAYSQNLFSGYSETATIFNKERDFVLSIVNGSLTRESRDLYGYHVGSIINTHECIGNKYQLPLWDSSTAFQRMKKNKRSGADISNIHLARYFTNQRNNFFFFINDNDQITQAQIEGFKYMRPSSLLVWLIEEGYIRKQKAVWVYEKVKKHDPRWVKQNTAFRDVFYG